jgi:hypothetical protein
MLKSFLGGHKKVVLYHIKYIVEYIMESKRMKERRERAKAYNRLHCIEIDNNNEYRDLYL